MNEICQEEWMSDYWFQVELRKLDITLMAH
jgi:hypothetical protein